MRVHYSVSVLFALMFSLNAFAQEDTNLDGTSVNEGKKGKKEKAEKAPKEKNDSAETIGGSADNQSSGEDKPVKEKKPKPPFYAHKLPVISVGAGCVTFFGDDMLNGIAPYNFANWRYGINGSLEHRTFSALGFRLNFLYGKIAENERSIGRNYNVESTIMQGDFNILIYLDNNLIINRASKFSPYLFGGVGFMSFDPRADLIAAGGQRYYYWDDGRIADRPKSDENLANYTPLVLDGKYETKLDSAYDGEKINKTGLTIPFGLALRYKFSNKFSADVSFAYYWTLTDHLDGFKSGDQTDHFLYSSVSFAYHIAARKPKPAPSQFDEIDFNSLDTDDDDGDGVKNMLDLCAGTPTGANVDDKGCPVDTDKDGVPDFMDDEPNSAADAVVDMKGVAIGEDFLERDTIGAKRDNLYQAFPKLKYAPVGSIYSEGGLEVEVARREPTKELGDFSVVDLNGDGYISADEIATAIDSFFEGGLNFSAAKLHELIDFFFEQ